MITVEVIQIPVRYGGKTYLKGEQFIMSEEYYEAVSDFLTPHGKVEEIAEDPLVTHDKESKKRGGKAAEDKDGSD